MVTRAVHTSTAITALALPFMLGSWDIHDSSLGVAILYDVETVVVSLPALTLVSAVAVATDDRLVWF